MPALSRDLILDKAVEVADRDGLEAVTLRRVAVELGVHVTSLYHHVPTKDAVLDGLVERLIAEAGLPDVEIGWEQWVRHFVAAMGTLATRHPGAFAALQTRPVQGEQAVASFEVALAAFVRAGLPPEDAYGAVKATTLIALGTAGERALQSAGSLAETSLDQLPAERFPQVRALADVTDVEAAWAFGLETLVSGLRAQVRKRKT